MLSAGAAFLLAYLPSRRVTQLVRRDLLDRVAPTIDPALKHAVELARKGLSIEEPLIEKATAQAARLAAGAGIALPPAPAAAPGVAAWLAALAAAIRPLLASPVLELAWSAGETARTIQIAAGAAAQVAYLRCASPEHPELRAAADAHAAELTTAAAALAPLLAGTELPMVVGGADRIARLVQRTRDLTPTATAGYRQLNELARTLAEYFESTARDLDVPPPARASAPPTPREEALLAAILADPDDDAPRLELAELAARRGDPRAEMIREQLAQRAKRSRERPADEVPHLRRARELEISHPEWAAPLVELGARDVKFWRGFPDEITIDAETFLARGAALLARAPVTSLHVRAATRDHLRALVTSPLLARIARLDLDEQGVTDDELAALAASPHAARLRWLALRGNHITERGVEAIAASPHLRGLEGVDLSGNPADPVDQLEDHDETHQHLVPTPAGQALEARYGRLRWLHPEPPL